ncbi:MAG: S41 family peptidase, partial [Tannerellaceae bacterium]
MKRKTLLSLLACTCIGSSIYAQDAPLWLRNCTISPDGSTIAFCYKGDIYTVPSQGGKASQITTHTAHDTRPIWSQDGRNIAFASDRKGSFDVYTVSKNGGVPTQLTSHSANEYPEVYLNDKVLFSASIQNDVNHIKFPSRVYSQIYEVSTNGGRSKLYSSEGLENICFSKDGKKA